MSSFVAGLLTSGDAAITGAALQLAQLLMAKLPDLFRMHFVKEGVAHAIDKLAASAPLKVCLLACYNMGIIPNTSLRAFREGGRGARNQQAGGVCACGAESHCGHQTARWCNAYACSADVWLSALLWSSGGQCLWVGRMSYCPSRL